jgi:hypothetical protein
MRTKRCLGSKEMTMKQFMTTTAKRVALSMAVLGICFFLTGSAAAQAAPQTNTLVGGVWGMKSQDTQGNVSFLYLAFHANGQFRGIKIVQGKVAQKIAGTYTFANGTLTMTTGGKTLKCPVTFANADTLNNNGKTWYRIKK